jgi:glycosyltransferase involved in cell wall biosynthesis
MLEMSNEKPAVSVIIPTYNRAHLIGRAIQSVLDQTYQDFEIIIVDDGSTDNTEVVLKKFQNKDERIRYIRHDKNKGGSTARNTGIKAARGRFIALLDSDDEWLPEKLQKQLEVFESSPPEVGVVYTKTYHRANKKIYPFSKEEQKDGMIFQDLLNLDISKNCGQTSTLLIKKECFEKVGLFDERFPRQQDTETIRGF